jgi:hypothetical protein
MVVAISRRYLSSDFPNGLSLDQKIEVFADRILGWQLEPAQELADKVPHSGYAVLHVVMSYFEAIAKFEDGYCETGSSKNYFKSGFRSVLRTSDPSISDATLDQLDTHLDHIYEHVRCGLYHAGMTGSGIILSGELNGALAINNHVIYFNPHQIVGLLTQHFRTYLQILRDSRQGKKRMKFERRFDYLESGNP